MGRDRASWLKGEIIHDRHDYPGRSPGNTTGAALRDLPDSTGEKAGPELRPQTLSRNHCKHLRCLCRCCDVFCCFAEDLRKRVKVPEPRAKEPLYVL